MIILSCICLLLTSVFIGVPALVWWLDYIKRKAQE